jgi:flagellar hook-associated protein 1 FlgK
MSILLNLGARAMLANQVALNTIGHNISNANTPGYSRQTVVLGTATPQFSGGGFLGKGVQVEAINRSYNRFLTSAANTASSDAQRDEALRANLERLEKIFPPGEQGLGNATNQFLSSMIDLGSRPADPSSRQVVLGRAKEVATRFASAGAQLAELQAGVNSELKSTTNLVNELAQQLAAVNREVAGLMGSGQSPNDLLDRRDQLVAEIAKHISISSIEAGDGSMSVFIGGGQRLVLGGQAEKLLVQSDPYDQQRSRLALQQPNGTLPLESDLLGSGKLSALLSFQNDDLQLARNAIGQIAAALSMRINEQQALGLDLSDPPGSGAAIFSVGGPLALPANTNARDGAGNFLSGVLIERVDADFLQASSYTLRSDPANAGQYLLERDSDGLVRTVADGDVVDGFRITFNPAPPGPLDTYRLEPVSAAAVGMRRTLDSVQGLAAASPLTAVMNINNTGTATLASIYAVDSSFSTLNLPIEVEFGVANGDGSVPYTMTGPFGAVNGTWFAGQPIGNEAGVALGFALRLNGVPRDGDLIQLDPTQFPGQNNGNVRGFLDLQEEGFIGKQLLAGGAIAAGATISEAYAATVGEVGTRTQSAQFLAAVSTGVAENAESARSGEAGVNLDEEAARLMQYQQAYQASAKMLQVAQSIFDELINAVR